MTTFKQTFLIGIVVTILGYLIYNSHNVKTDIQLYHNHIDSLQQSIDSVEGVNKMLDNKLGKIDTNIHIINNEISQVEKNITIIKNQTNEKVNNIDKFSYSELEQFFTNRYK